MTQKRKKISIIQRIIERILGKKFYISVVAQKGTSQYFVNSTIFRSEEEVKAHKQHVERDCPSLSFRLSVGKAVDAEEAKKLAEKEK